MDSVTLKSALEIATSFMSEEQHLLYANALRIAYLDSRIEAITNELESLMKMRKIPTAQVEQRAQRIAYLQEKLPVVVAQRDELVKSMEKSEG